MKTVSQILMDENGLYEWRRHDCLTTVRAIVLNATGVEVDFSYWHGKKEVDAIAEAKRDYGGSGSLNMDLLGKFDEIDVQEHEYTPIQRGDILAIEGIIEACGATWDTYSKGDLTAFVGDSYDIYHWTFYGLFPIETTSFSIKGVMRCHSYCL